MVGARLNAFYFHALARSPVQQGKVIARFPLTRVEACNQRPRVGLPLYKVLVLYNMFDTADDADLDP